MRILLWTVPPWSETGYGVVANHVANGLRKRGHDVAFFCFCGLHFHDIEWDGFKCYPNLTDTHSWVYQCAEDYKADIILLIFDLWVAKEHIREDYPILIYSPVDHQPLAPWLVEPARKCKWIVPMCKFGKERYNEAGLDTLKPIYHGVDTKIYKPMDKEDCKQEFGLDSSGFYFLTVAVNKGDRKNLPGMLRAFRMFLDEVPDNNAQLVYWGYPYFDGINPSGFDLPRIWDLLIKGRPELKSRFLTMPQMTSIKGITPQKMAKLYNAADALLLATYGEGFGLPIIEAGACKVPSIVQNFSAPAELVKGRGWLVEPGDWYCQQYLSTWQRIPRLENLVHCMVDAYNNEEKRKLYGNKMYKFSRTLDWNNICNQWDTTLRQVIKFASLATKQGGKKY